MMLLLERNLAIISKEGRIPSRRYIVKHFANGAQERWGVYDQRERRFLKNREVNALSEREVREGI